jgi:hypothetical protein
VNYAASFGAAVPANIKIVCAAAGMIGVVGFCLIGRARLRATEHVDV